MRRRPSVLAAAALTAASLMAAAVTLTACTGRGVEPAGGTPTSPAPTAVAATPGAPTPGAASTVTGRATGTVTGTSQPLVVETVFGQVDLDPTQQFGRTNAIVAKAVYQTLTTLSSTDPTRAEPALAQYTISPEGRWLTLRLRADATFSDGTPVTTDDVIFTLARAGGLGGAPSRVLGTITMAKVDERTMTITSPGANFELPAILANPAFGILNAAVVKAHGGTIGPQDRARSWLQTHSAGSGPYVLAARQAGSITLAANPHWSGPAPAHPEVVIKDATPAQQVSDLESRAADIVLDLSPFQAEAVQLDPADAALQTDAATSSTIAYLMLNRSRSVNRWTSDPDFAEAVRLGVDRTLLAQFVAGGATPATGLIPHGIVGALAAPSDGATPLEPTPTSTSTATPAPAPSAAPTDRATADLPAARAALKRSGYTGEPLTLVYPDDEPIAGVQPGQLADAIAYQLAQVGITVRPSGTSTARALADYEAGRQSLALWSFTPDYPGPGNYLLFAPGHPLGLRAGWPLRANPAVDDLTIAALNSVGANRSGAYTAWQEAMDAAGPFVPLVQPAAHYAYGPRVSELSTSPIWTVDLALTR